MKGDHGDIDATENPTRFAFIGCYGSSAAFFRLGPGGYDGGYRGHYHGHGGGGAALGLFALGTALVIGATDILTAPFNAVAAVNQPAYYPPQQVYYAPQPAYYAPPIYQAPQPVYYSPPAYYAPPGYYAPRPY